MFHGINYEDECDFEGFIGVVDVSTILNENLSNKVRVIVFMSAKFLTYERRGKEKIVRVLNKIPKLRKIFGGD